MNKRLYTLVVAVQLSLVIGALVFERLSQTKMGVMRHVLYTNTRWERLWPVDLIAHSAAGMLVILTALYAVQWFSHRAVVPGKTAVQLSTAMGMSVLTAVFMVMCSTADFRTYYTLCMAFFLTALLQCWTGWSSLRHFI